MLALHGVGMRIGALTVLDGVTLTVPPGRCVGVAGPSGSGKTTLLHVAGLLLAPTSGSVMWQGTRPADPVGWRRRTAGFVFQDFCLLPELSALTNVLLPAGFDRYGAGGSRPRAVALLRDMGIADPARRAGLLSRGEQQRVAIARALLRAPAMILADEPTASLDATTGASIASLLLGAARAANAGLLVVSHDMALLERLDEVRTLRAGRLE